MPGGEGDTAGQDGTAHHLQVAISAVAQHPGLPVKTWAGVELLIFILTLFSPSLPSSPPTTFTSSNFETELWQSCDTCDVIARGDWNRYAAVLDMIAS